MACETEQQNFDNLLDLLGSAYDDLEQAYDDLDDRERHLTFNYFIYFINAGFGHQDQYANAADLGFTEFEITEIESNIESIEGNIELLNGAVNEAYDDLCRCLDG